LKLTFLIGVQFDPKDQMWLKFFWDKRGLCRRRVPRTKRIKRNAI